MVDPHLARRLTPHDTSVPRRRRVQPIDGSALSPGVLSRQNIDLVVTLIADYVPACPCAGAQPGNGRSVRLTDATGATGRAGGSCYARSNA